MPTYFFKDLVTGMSLPNIFLLPLGLLENVTDGQREDIMLFLYMAKNGKHTICNRITQVEQQIKCL